MPDTSGHRLVATPIPGEQGCAEDCPHTEHVDAPFNVTFQAPLKGPLTQWLADLGLLMGHMPTDPEEAAGMHAYVVIVRPGTPAARALGGFRF